ncbi:uncharacterized protein METZ01_LOCUS436481, partial [marine metagenome]
GQQGLNAADQIHKEKNGGVFRLRMDPQEACGADREARDFPREQV